MARRRRAGTQRLFLGFTAPWTIGFLLLTVAPFAYAFALSLTSYDGLSTRWRFVGASNYREALHDPDLRHSLTRTALFVAVVVPLTTALALAVALLVRRPARGVSFFRSLYFLPAILPVVASALMFRLVFERDTGLANAVLERLGIDDVFWLQDPTAFPILVTMICWGLGVGMMIFLAALQDIPKELLDAAAVDGAGPLRQFFNVTLPLLTPVILFQLVAGMIAATQTMVEPLLLAPTSTATGAGAFGNVSGVPGGTRLYLVHVASQLFASNRFGYASALMCILFVLLVVVSALLLRASRRWVFYGGASGQGGPTT